MNVHATGCYSMKEIAWAFDVHYATVSRSVNKKQGENVGMQDLTLTLRVAWHLAVVA
jgi:transposase